MALPHPLLSPFKVHEPAIDVASAAALISSVLDVAPPPNAVFFGEVGLSGEASPHNEPRHHPSCPECSLPWQVRPAFGAHLRVQEAARSGVQRAFIPRANWEEMRAELGTGSLQDIEACPRANPNSTCNSHKSLIYIHLS